MEAAAAATAAAPAAVRAAALNAATALTAQPATTLHNLYEQMDLYGMLASSMLLLKLTKGLTVRGNVDQIHSHGATSYLPDEHLLLVGKYFASTTEMLQQPVPKHAPAVTMRRGPLLEE